MLKNDSSKVPKGKEMKYHMMWVNLFGCKADLENKQAKKQNDDLSLATTFKGRVLVEYMTIDDKHPVTKIRNITEDKSYK